MERDGLDVFEDQHAVAPNRSGWRWAVVVLAMVVGWTAILAAVGFLIWGFGWLTATILNSYGHPL